jgi:surface polysaccharide O-acyltransferase-like enzyme
VLKDFDKKTPSADYKWDQLVLLCVVSMFAIFLPRQFHTAIIEIKKHISRQLFGFSLVSFAFQSFLYFNRLGVFF